MSHHIEPRMHTGGSRFTAAVGGGANRGLRWGVLGAIGGAVLGLGALGGIGYGIYAAGAAWIGAMGAATSTAAAIGIGVAGVAAIPVGIIGVGMLAAAVAPAVIGIGGIGALLGITTGAGRANQRTGQEHEAARYAQAYQQTKSQIQGAMMAQMVEPQPEPAMAVAADNPYHQASSKIDAATIAHQQTVDGPQMQQARV